MSLIRKLHCFLSAQDLELDKYHADIVRAVVFCRAATPSSCFCMNISYKVAPYKYIWNYVQGSLLKLHFHRWNILILHYSFSDYFYCWLKCLSYVSAGQIAILSLYTVKSSTITVAMLLVFLWIVWSWQRWMRCSWWDRWISMKFTLC